MKTCSSCRKEKSISEFYKRGDGQRGVRSTCKACQAKQTKAKMGVGRQRYAYHLRYKYNLPLAEYQCLLIAQSNRCCICMIEFTENGVGSPYVDHDHVTGTVRGLLCRRCNSTLGAVKEDVGVLSGMIDYLVSFGHGRARVQIESKAC